MYIYTYIYIYTYMYSATVTQSHMWPSKTKKNFRNSVPDVAAQNTEKRDLSNTIDLVAPCRGAAEKKLG